MGRFKEKLQNFMYGRNGNDALNTFFFVLYFLFIILHLIFINNLVLRIVFMTLATFFFIIIFFRFFSRRIDKRQKANDCFLNITRFLRRPFLRFFHKIRDRKTHIYKKCPHCKQSLRLKKIKGEHTVKCPICSFEFKIKI